VRHPVAGELLDHGERHALRLIRNGLLLGQVRRRDAPSKVLQLLLRHIDLEGSDLRRGFDGGPAHGDLLGVAGDGAGSITGRGAAAITPRGGGYPREVNTARGSSALTTYWPASTTSEIRRSTQRLDNT